MSAKTHAGMNWTEFRKLPNLVEVDFHWSDRGRREVDYAEAMHEVYLVALESIQDAHAKGLSYVLMTHGSSTSRSGKETARSVIRGLMRSKEATPYIVRSRSIQHKSCFVAAIRPIK